MKNIFYFFLIFITTDVMGQISIPNGEFENWTSSVSSSPQYYPFNTNRESFFKTGGSYSISKTLDAFHGQYALMLSTVQSNAGGDTCAGSIAQSDNPSVSVYPLWQGGIPYNEQPTGIRGYYKAFISMDDTARIGVIFKKGGTVAAYFCFPIYGMQMGYTPFNLSFIPQLTAVPDTVIFFASSSDMLRGKAVPGSLLKLDSVTFTGVASQPALMNGDFELWNSDTVFIPWSWNIGNSNGMGVTRTPDGFWGHAAEITTFADKLGTHTKARSGDLVNGNWDDNCACWKGGYPFSNQADTLIFNYKYLPMGNDSATVKLYFRKGGASIYNAGMTIGAAASYQQAKVPFNAGQSPDSVVVQFKSSLWHDTTATYIGSDLKIDNVHFVSQPLSGVPEIMAENQIIIFPNPSGGEFSVQSTLFNIESVEVFNMVGEKIISKHCAVKHAAIDLGNVSEGIYFIKAISEGKTFTKKISIDK